MGAKRQDNRHGDSPETQEPSERDTFCCAYVCVCVGVCFCLVYCADFKEIVQPFQIEFLGLKASMRA